jgi:hypothetical protein
MEVSGSFVKIPETNKLKESNLMLVILTAKLFEFTVWLAI